MHIDLPEDIYSKLESSYKDPNPALFLPAEKIAETKMENELLDQFLESEEYKAFKATNEPMANSRPISPS